MKILTAAYRARLHMLAARAGAFAEPPVDTLETIDGFSQEDFEAYITSVNPFEETDALLGDTLFPNDPTEKLTSKTLKGGSRAAVMADVVAHQSEGPIVARRSVESISFDIPAIKQKRQLDAETLIRLREGRDAVVQQAVQEIFDDTTAVRRAVKATVEFLRMQVLAYGIATLDWTGVKGAIDFDVPAGHKEVLAGASLWTDAASVPLDDLRRWQDALIADRGNRAEVAVTSAKVISTLAAHASVRKAIFGANSDRVVTQVQLNQLMQSMDLPLFVAYDKQAKRLDAAGAEINTRYFPQNRLTLIPALAPVGTTKRAPVPQESIRDMLAGRFALDGERIGVHTYVSSTDPVGVMTLGIASAFPSFEGADDVFQAQPIA